MNAIINWVALNNTLLIRVGFSAVIILILVYAYRFFFVPEISVVETAETIAAKSAGTSGDLNIEELAELQSEVENLKTQLKKAMAERAKEPAGSSTTNNASLSAAATSGGGLDMVAEQSKLLEERTKSEKELNDKVKNLEARLSEYEIIAEDLAEISKLKQENETLKTKLAEAATEPARAPNSESQTLRAASPQPETVVAEEEPELPTEVESNPELEALENYVASTKKSEDIEDTVLPAPDEPMPADGGAEVLGVGDKVAGSAISAQQDMVSQIFIKSEVEVTNEDKNNLNDFEKYLQAKKG